MREHFAKILGAANAHDNENELLAYSYDASGIQGKARIVLFPKTGDHIRQILTYANRTNISVVVRGLGANPMGMAVPDNSIIIDMKHFDRIRTLDLKSKSVTVDAGVVLSDLQRLLRKHGMRFPVLPQSSNVATIGGLLAMNQMGRRSYRHGRLDKHVLSLEVIDGTGKHYPDGHTEFVGMEGTGAIILSAKIKIIPEEDTTSDVFTFDDVHDLLGSVRELRADLDVLAIEYLNPKCAKLLGEKPKHHLMVEYASDAGKLAQDAQEKLWRMRGNAWDAATRAEHPIIEDCELDEDQIPEFLAWCEEQDLPVAGHIGMGIMHPFVPADFVREDYYDFLETLGASPVGQFGHGLIKKKYISDHLKHKTIQQKDRYDYQDILNRGKLVDYA